MSQANSTAFDSFRLGIPTNHTINSLDFIKQRLAYEWKNIFRTLTNIDLGSKGSVGLSEFATAVTKNRVYMTREELKKIQ